MAPKVRGGWLLHQLTRRHRLDFFVLFSSTSAVLGAIGQGNYAAANAFLDGLAHYRRVQGGAALSVAWGAWSEVGMAARLQGRERGRMANRGIGVIAPEQGQRTLERLLNQPSSNVTVLPIRWATFVAAHTGPVPALLRVVAKGAAGRNEPGRQDSSVSTLRAQLDAVPEAERAGLLLAFLREQVAKVLSLESGEGLDEHTPFTTLGLDSLMAVEMRNAVSSAMGQALPASLTFDYPTIERLATFMATQLGGRTPVPATAETAKSEARQWEQVSEQLDELSEDQMAALLASQLATLGRSEGDE